MGFNIGDAFKAATSAIPGPTGTAFGTYWEMQGAKKQNEFNAEMQRRNMEYQRHMSNTSYQRRMADLSAAGLNPMLAYSSGGATTPSGGMASGVNPNEGTSSAAQKAWLIKKEKEMINYQIDNLKADNQAKKAMANKSNAEADLQKMNRKLQKLNLIFQNYKLGSAKAEADYNEGYHNINKELLEMDAAQRRAGKWFPLIRDILQGIFGGNRRLGRSRNINRLPNQDEHLLDRHHKHLWRLK